jgi:MoaA/NifB/PqqE/SkfB family radical SAM enzyme
MTTIAPTPTKRAVIDPLRLCNIRCLFCYYSYQEMKSVRPYKQVRRDIDSAIERGNNYIDITGGEPFLYKELEKLIEYSHKKGLRVCVITNALAGERKTNSVLDAGVDALLISVHGKKETHDYLVQRPGARKAQERFLEQVRGRVPLRFNYVMNHFNQAEILETAQWLATFNPKIVNFINMNPHYEWGDKFKEIKDIVADLHVVERQLTGAIAFLEEKNIGVNIRYYPMCRIPEKYRRCICNDLHVAFDPFEWDYGIQPKTNDAFYAWGKQHSEVKELKEEPCSSCSLQWICGGINKSFNTATAGTMISKVVDDSVDTNNFYYYRQHNLLTLDFK